MQNYTKIMHNLLDFFPTLADMITIGDRKLIFENFYTDEKADEQILPATKTQGWQRPESFSRVVADEQGRTGQEGSCVSPYHFQNRRRVSMPDGHQAKNHSGTWPKFI
jgi:hypothetical protein